MESRISRFIATIILSTFTQGVGLSTAMPVTLSSWSKTVFENLPEYSSGINHSGQYPKPIFTSKEFQALADDLIALFRGCSFNQSMSWLDEKAPSLLIFLPISTRDYFLNPYQYAHVQRKTLLPKSQICFVGDIHGSIHSVLRMLWRLVLLGKLADDFTIIDPNFYMVFNGDFVDRGRYGIEVWYTLLLLKLANPDRVFLLRGNHEDITIQSSFGFVGIMNWFGQLDMQSGELYAKFKDDADALSATIAHLCSFLPHALYLGSTSGGQSYYFQCCHGGIETEFDPCPLLLSSRDKFQIIPESSNTNACHQGFNWSDFCQHGDGQIIFNASRGAGYLADVVATEAYLANINGQLTSSNTRLTGFIRGHQDRAFGCKMLFKPEKFRTVFEPGGYQNGPYHWKNVATAEDQKTSTLGLATYAPVFTFTTAAEGQGVGYDCFGVLTLGTTFEECTLKVYEVALAHDRNNTFISIKPSSQQKSGSLVDSSWTSLPANCSIDPQLIIKAKYNQQKRICRFC